MAIVNNEAHKKFVQDCVTSHVLKRIADNTHHFHDADVSDDVRRIVAGLFETMTSPANAGDDEDGMMTSEEEEPQDDAD